MLPASISYNCWIEATMPRIKGKIGTMESPLNSVSDGIFKGKDEKCIDFNFQLPSYRPITFKGIVYTLIYP